MKKYMVEITLYRTHRIVVEAESLEDIQKMYQQNSGPLASWPSTPVVRGWEDALAIEIPEGPYEALHG